MTTPRKKVTTSRETAKKKVTTPRKTARTERTTLTKKCLTQRLRPRMGTNEAEVRRTCRYERIYNKINCIFIYILIYLYKYFRLICE